MSSVEAITPATADQLSRRPRLLSPMTISRYKMTTAFVITLPSSADESWRAWMREAFPRCEWLGKREARLNNSWRVDGTDFSALTILHAIHEDDYVFEDEEVELRFQYLIKRFYAYNKRAELQANYKLNGAEPTLPDWWIDHPDLPLSKCQRTAVAFSLMYEGSALFMDRGTGKTATTINRICNEASRKPKHMYRALVVCPNQVRVNWYREILKFSTVDGKVTIIKGTREARMRQFVQAAMPEDDCQFSVMIIGYDTLSADPSLYTKRRMWDLVVCDESHYFKADYTKRWKKGILPLRDASKRRMILTGTPIGNSVMDLWTQLEFLGEGLSGFTKFGDFRQHHGDWVPVGPNGVQKLVGVVNVALLQERLTRMAFTVTKEEAGLDLPDKVYDTFEVDMTPAQERIYKQLSKDLLVELEDRMSGEVNAMTIENVLTSLLRLAQITSGFVTYDQVVDPYTEEVVTPKRIEQIKSISDEGNPKLEAVKKLLRSADSNSKTIIWCCFVEDIKQLAALCEELGIKHGTYYGATKQAKRQEYEDAFNRDPDFKVLICNPQTAGEGLNLLGYDVDNPDDYTTYCGHEIFFSCNWSSIQRGQAEDRAHRRGTRMPVQITDIVIPGTIDEEIREAVLDKQKNAMTVMDVRNILSRL